MDEGAKHAGLFSPTAAREVLGRVGGHDSEIHEREELDGRVVTATGAQRHGTPLVERRPARARVDRERQEAIGEGHGSSQGKLRHLL